MPIPISPLGILRKLFLCSVMYFGSEYCGKPLGLAQCAVLGYLTDAYFFFMSVHAGIAALSLFTAKMTEHEEALAEGKDN
jgi:hypothetical protein